MKIYTKTGDRGETRLFDGTHVRKDNPRVEAYGSVDELNAFIGAAASSMTDPALVKMLQDVQRDLFTLGAQLADPRAHNAATAASAKSQLDPQRIRALEEAIDRFETELPPLRQFILAGGCQPGASLHVARTVCRRAERSVTALAAQVQIHTSVIEYLNRLSDFLFVLARLVNHQQGQQEIPW